MAKQEKKEDKKRPDTPLAETPTYNMDASTLKDKLKSIQEESNKRREAAYAARKEALDKRKEKSRTRIAGDGGRLQGLNANFGSKVITK